MKQQEVVRRLERAAGETEVTGDRGEYYRLPVARLKATGDQIEQ